MGSIRAHSITVQIRRARLIGFSVFFVLVLFSVFVSLTLRTNIEHKAVIRFNQLSDEFIFQMEKLVLRYGDFLNGLRGFFNASDYVSSQDFKQYTHTLKPWEMVGVSNVRFLKRVPEKEKQRFIEELRAEGAADGKLIENFLTQSSRLKPEYFPQLYIEPQAGYESLLGMDFSETPERWEAMQSARDTGEIMASLPYVSTAAVEKGILSSTVYGALYRKGAELETVENRREALFGFVAIVVRLPNLFQVFEQGARKLGVRLEVFEGVEKKQEKLIFSSASGSADFSRGTRSQLHKEKIVSVLGRSWLASVESDHPKQVLFLERWIPFLALAGGVILSLLASGFIYLLMTRNARAEQRAQEMFDALRDAQAGTVQAHAQVKTLDEFNRELEKKVAERTATLEESNKKLYLQAQVLNATANGIVIADIDGKILWANAAVSRLTGYSIQELIGKNPRVLKSGKHDQAFYEGLWKTVLSGEVWVGEVINKRKDGSLYNERMTITPVKDETGKIMNFVAIKEDVTAQKILEEQFRQSQKMEVVGQLAGGVAHDFNNLLTVINGYCELLEMQVKPEDKIYAHLLAIKRAGQRAAVLTGQLLSMGRRNLVSAVNFDLNHTISDSQQILARLLPENVSLEVLCDPGIGLIRGDENQIHQVLLNLVINARDALPEGGTIQIKTALADLTARDAAENPGMRPGRYVLMAVKDTGIGMTEEVKKRLFEPFFTTKEKGKGTGLGLPTCYGIMKQHGGYIRIETELGKGSTFFVYLPMANLSQEEMTALQSEKEDLGGQAHETVLVVEDEEGVRGFVADSLKAKGYQVIEAENGVAAKKVIEQKQPFDLVLSDIMMPAMDGKKFYEYMQSIGLNKPVIFMSGYAEDAPFRREIEKRKIPFMQKPFKTEVLLAKIRQVLNNDAGR